MEFGFESPYLCITQLGKQTQMTNHKKYNTMKNLTILSALFTFISFAAFAQNNEIGTRAQNSASLNCPASLSAEIVGETMLCDASSAYNFSKYKITLEPGVSQYNWTLPQGMSIRSGQGSNRIFVEIDYSFSNGYITVSGQTACGTTSSKTLYVDVVPAAPKFDTYEQNVQADMSYQYSVENISGVSYVWTAPYGAVILEGQGTSSVKIKFSQSFTGGDVEVYAENACAVGQTENLNIAMIPSMLNDDTNIITLNDGTTQDQSSLYNESDRTNNDRTVASTELAEENHANVYNYPNPVTSSTRFYVSLGHNYSETESIMINIFDIKGQLVKIITSTDNNGQGKFNAETWNAADENGNPLAAGVYFYNVTAQDNSGRINTIAAKSNIQIR
jgi:hypothetical protein